MHAVTEAGLPSDEVKHRPSLAGSSAAWPHCVLAPPPLQLRGPWAFVAYDRGHGRILAARDPAGVEPLFWGSTLLSEGVLFASEK